MNISQEKLLVLNLNLQNELIRRHMFKLICMFLKISAKFIFTNSWGSTPDIFFYVILLLEFIGFRIIANFSSRRKKAKTVVWSRLWTATDAICAAWRLGSHSQGHSRGHSRGHCHGIGMAIRGVGAASAIKGYRLSH